MKRTTQILLALVGMLLISFAVPLTAQAEQCSPDGKICLVTDTSQALLAPAPIQFKVTSSATSFSINDRAAELSPTGPYLSLCGPSGITQQGPPGGMSVWMGELCPIDQDATFTVEAKASIPWSGPCDPNTGSGCGSDYVSATFSVSVQAVAIDFSTKVKRRGSKGYVANMSYVGRGPGRAKLHFYIATGAGGMTPLRQAKKVKATGAGPQSISLGISRKTVKQHCQHHNYCELFARGEFYVDGNSNDVSETYQRLVVKRLSKKTK